jgi:flagellar basal-body rod protein FlgF
MDNTLYIAMAGALSAYDQQNVYSNNLANVNTTGFRADLYQAQSRYVVSDGVNSQVYVTSEPLGVDGTAGAIMTTGRELDAAIIDKGYFAVQDKNGNEAYSRNGNFTIDEDGILKTMTGNIVLGDGGAISLPPAKKIEIASDGTISILPLDGDSTSLAVIGRLKLVNPPANQLTKNSQGLLVQKNGGLAPVDSNVKLQSGALESSNVNGVAQMIGMITANREFEAQVKIIQTIDQNDESLAQLLQV